MKNRSSKIISPLLFIFVSVLLIPACYITGDDEDALVVRSCNFEEQPTEVFTVVEQMPAFPGCEDISSQSERRLCTSEKMMAFVYDNLQYPEEAYEKGIEGTVIIRFAVRKDGVVCDATILKEVGYGTGEESIRIVESMPNWTPGAQREIPVHVYYNLPIEFTL